MFIIFTALNIATRYHTIKSSKIITENGKINRKLRKKTETEIKNWKTENLKIITEKVVKRKETYNLGSRFYLKKSEIETLYLQEQYYDDLQYLRKFPNIEFEISKTLLISGTLLT